LGNESTVHNVWNPSPVDFQLSATEVQVWRIDLIVSMEAIQQLTRLLSADEYARSQRFRFQQHRDRFTVGRGVLRTLLGQYLDTPPDQLQFEYSSYGKPSLLPVRNGKTVQFNVTHSGDVALVAIALDRRVGVDLEQIRSMPEAKSLAQRFFAASESAHICTLPTLEQQMMFFRYWTCKEAYLKAIGSGIAHGLDQVAIDFSETSAALTNTPDSEQWTIWELSPAVGYTAAVVAAQHEGYLTCWRWQ
jgi:4'-phosphopantetheinyl transferase